MTHRLPLRRAFRAAFLLVAACGWLAAPVARADTVTQILTHAFGKHWMLQDDGSGNFYWSDHLVPSVGNLYVVPNAMNCRTPTGGGTPDFPADIRVDPGGRLAMKQNYNADVVITGDLIMNGGRVSSWNGTTGGYSQKLNMGGSNVSVAAASLFDVGGTDRRRIDLINATITGSADLTLSGGNDANDILQLQSSVSGNGFTGDWTVSGGRLVVFGNQLGDTSRVTLNATSWLDFRGNETIGSLDGVGQVRRGTSGGTFTLNVGNDNLDGAFSGTIINNSGTVALRKIGTGAQTLTGSSSYTGATTVDGGYLRVGHANACGSGSMAKFDGGDNDGTLVLFNDITFSKALTFEARHDNGNPPFIDNESGSNTLSGNITWNAGGAYFGIDSQAGTLVITDSTGTVGGGDKEFRFGGAGDIIFSGQIGTTAKKDYVTKNGAGTLYLDRTSNLYKGKTTLNAGTVVIKAENGLGANPTDAYHQDQLTFNGGTLRVTETFDIDDSWRGMRASAGGGTFEVDSGKTLTLKKTIDSTGHVTKTGPGTLVTTRNNPYSGGTTISAGTFQVGIYGNDGTLGAGDITNNATLKFARDNNYTLSAKLSGTGTLIQDGNHYGDYVQLSGANDYTGPTLLNGGTLRVGNNGSALGTAAAGTVINTKATQTSWNSPTLRMDGANIAGETLEMNSDLGANLRTRLQAGSGANTWGGAITVKGDGNVQINCDGASTTFDVAGGIVGTDPTTMMIRGSSASGTVSSVINTPNATFVKTGGGTWTLNSPGNSWATTQISDGTVRLGTNDGMPVGIPVRIGQGGSSAYFDMAGYNQAATGLEVVPGSPSSQTIGNSSTTADSVLTISSTTNYTYAGRIWDVLGGGTRKVSVVMAAGQQTLSGTSTYTGPTTVSGGTLLVSGSVASDVTVQSGGTYGGGGSCPNLAVQNGGTHAPGASIGTDTVTGTYNLSGSLAIEVDGTGVGSADSVNVTGALNLNAGSSLDITEWARMDDWVYVIAQYGSLAGEFSATNNLPDGYEIDYAYAGGTQVAIVLNLHIWDGGAGDDSWASGQNWVGDQAFAAVVGDAVIFQDDGSLGSAGLVNSVLDQDRTVGSLTMTNGPGNYHTIDLASFGLTIEGNLVVGDDGLGSHVTFDDTVSGGALIVTNGTMRVGHDGGTTTLDVDAPFTYFETNATLEIARRDAGVGTPTTTATVDLSGAGGSSIKAAELRIGTAVQSENGQVYGTLTLSDTGNNVVEAATITVADSPQAGNTGGTSYMHLGGANTINADMVYIARKKSKGLFDIDSGGTLTLAGKNGAAADLRIGYNDAGGTGTISDGDLNLSGGTFNATLGELILGRHVSGNGAGDGTLIMSDGTVTADSVTLAHATGNNPQNSDGILTMNGGSFIVADSVTDMGGTSEIGLNDGTMTITNDLTVDKLFVGRSQDNPGSPAVLTAGGTATIGTGSQDLWVGRNTVNGNETHGTLDLSGASNVTCNVANLYVGSGSYEAYGILKLSETGTNDITAGTITIASVDPQGNTDYTSSVIAGGTTIVDANTVYISKRKSLGEVKFAASGGSLTMGSASDRVNNLRIAYNDANTGANGVGMLNGSNGTLVVYASAVVVGRHDRTSGLAGSGTGRICLDSAGDLFDATTVTLGHTDGDADATATGEIHMSGGTGTVTTLTLGNAKDGGHATGTLNFSGGTLNVTSLVQGNTSGTSDVDFNWSGGTLVAGSVNLGEALVQDGGTLAPGASVGTTTVTGDYTINSGNWAIEIDATGAGSSDTVSVSGTLNISGCILDITELAVADDEVYVIAQYGVLTGTFAAVNGVPADYKLVYGFGADNQIALVRNVSLGTVYRMRIAFDQYDKGDTLTNFPVLVVVSNGLNGFYYDDVQAGGTDLRFAHHDGVTPLDYEIESWGTGSEVSYIWVKVPELRQNSWIWAYWGGGQTAHALSQTNGAVWVADYEAVWHLHADARDATANDYDATSNSTANAGGIVANGENLPTPGTSYFTLPAGIVGMASGSLDIWFNTVQDVGNAAMLFWGCSDPAGGDGFGGQNELHLNLTPSEQLQLFIRGAANVSVTSSASYNDGQWHHAGVTWDLATQQAILFVDGRRVGADTAGGWNNFNFSPHARIGRPTGTFNSRYYGGLVDETRLSGIARSSNWVWATYMTVADNTGLLSYESAQRYTPAEADAYVRGGTHAAKNYGGANELVNKTSSMDYSRKSYARFDVSAIPAGATVNEASLHLTMRAGRNSLQPYTYRVYGLNDGDAGENWIEGTLNGGAAGGGEITWATAPANNTGSGYDYLGNATLLETYNFASTLNTGSHAVINSGGLRDFLNQDTDNKVTLMLSRTDTRDDAAMNFYSTEGVSEGFGEAPTLGFTYTTNVLDEPLFRLDADAVLHGSDAAVNALNSGAATILTNTFSDAASGKRFSVFRFSRIGALGNKTCTLTVKTAGGSGAAGNRPKTFHLWGLNDDTAEHWVEGVRNGATGEGDEISWTVAPTISEVYHDYPAAASGATVNNTLLVSRTYSLIGDGDVLVFEGNALDAFIHASEDSVVSFAITQSGAAANHAGWNFYARENAGGNAQAAALTAHDPKPPSAFLIR